MTAHQPNALPTAVDSGRVPTASRSRRVIDAPNRTLVGAGVFLVAAYALATLRIPLGRYFPSVGVSTDWVHMLGPGWQRPTLLYVGFVAVTFAAYGIALLAVTQRARWSPLLVFGFPAIFALALLPMYPPTAMDMFHYQAMGRIFWVFGANPLTTPQGAFPYPIGISWAELPSPYGPLWSLLAAPASILPSAHYVVGLLAFKAMAAASYLGCTRLIYVLVRRTRPGSEWLAVVLFAWNPFVVLRVVGDGHNDLWMMLGVLFALERAERRAWTTSLVALTLVVLLKYIPALLGPPLLLYIWMHAGRPPRARVAMLTRALALCAAITVVVYLPFWAGIHTFDALRAESAHMITSTPVLFDLYFERFLPVAAAEDDARTLTRVLFLACYLPLCWQARKSFDHLVSFSFAILFVYLVLAAAWFRPWYMLWPVTLAALRPRGWLGATLITITAAAALPDVVEQFRNDWPFLQGYDRAVAAPIILAFMPPVLVWLLGVTRTGNWNLGGSPALVAVEGLPPPSSAPNMPEPSAEEVNTVAPEQTAPPGEASR